MAPRAGTSDRSPASRARRPPGRARTTARRLDPGRCAPGCRNRGPATARRPAHGLGRAAWRRHAAGRPRRRGDQLAGPARTDRPALLRCRGSRAVGRRESVRGKRDGGPAARPPWRRGSARPVRGSRGCLRRGGLPAARYWWKPSSPAARRPSCSESAPDRFAEIVGAICSWQERWNRASAAPARLSRSRLEAELMGAAAELADSIPDEAAYQGWLAARCSSLSASAMPAVARHNDLTMRNVLVDDRGSVGVLDWAEAEAAGLPLTDFIYAVVDAAAACDGYRGRLDALRSCFLGGGSRAQSVATLQERLRASLQLSPRRPRARLSRLLAAPRAERTEERERRRTPVPGDRPLAGAASREGGDVTPGEAPANRAGGCSSCCPSHPTRTARTEPAG